MFKFFEVVTLLLILLDKIDATSVKTAAAEGRTCKCVR